MRLPPTELSKFTSNVTVLCKTLSGCHSIRSTKMPVRYEICVGLNKGHKTAKIKNVKYTGDKKVKGLRSSRLKNVQTKHTKFVRDLVREVVGHAPYEKRCMELLKISKDKRALKFCKARLGTHIRGKKKREELSNILTQMRKAGHAK
ncbi:hypothetical protein HA402_007170 [Bradysia odoriphaga]|nr:hypothetical protein HA402_007170 [Bradysia odoriphaga]